MRLARWALIVLCGTTVAHGGSSFQINQGISGAWYNPDTSGQGVLFDIEPASGLLFGAIFTYETATPDKLGAPEHRWLTVQGSYLGNQAQVPIYLTSGGVFDQPVATDTEPVGVATISFDSCTAATLSYALTDPPLTGSMPLTRVIPGTENLCAQMQTSPQPLPAQIGQEQATAFIDVSVLPMTDDDLTRVLAHQIVVVEDGLITRMGAIGSVVIPPDTVQIDGRGLFLGPGLTEMHLHIDTGGRIAAQDAGLLLIANGVTNVLNMGDGFGVGVPALGNRFESGVHIGPSLIAGNTAYGQGSGARVVNTPAQATAYAERLFNQGYEYIKEYWHLTPEVLSQFELESERLGLPIVGHIPLTRPMAESLSRGQRMAAHIQEPYASYMNYRTNINQIAPAAQIFLQNGTYMTPTMAVFQSYRLVYGGNQGQFDQLSQREGQQYTAQSIKAEWQRFFDSDTVRGNGQTIGGYDNVYRFFERMTRDFHEAGVPMLVGTDGPGFPGVMSGFAVHVELDLLRGIGMPVEAVYAAATRNAGRFVDETLAPAAGFGSIEVGRRADLNLLSGNPLESLEVLRQPLAVMARGRLWSRSYLQEQLDLLAQRVDQQSKFEDHWPSDAAAGSHHCVEHLGVRGPDQD
ncbi:MAG: amidohydrolase family protein [Xanthomonadales bacterium]|nr:amidohydrolase family protein [Xanthomonadales bacterium]